MNKPMAWESITKIAHYVFRTLPADSSMPCTMRPETPAVSYSITDPQALGTLLWEATVRSIAGLYGEDVANQHVRMFGAYTYVEPKKPTVDPDILILLCEQVEGHSWYGADYYTSRAYFVLREVVVRTIYTLAQQHAGR